MAEEKDQTIETKKSKYNLNIDEMASAGLHLGHRISKLHPKMLPFIFGMRNHIHIIDLEKSLPYFERALEFIEQLAKEDKILLFISTKAPLRDLVESVAKELNCPYITLRWVGGTFTNFSEVKKRIDYLKELEKKKEAGEFEKYTKKEQLQLERKIKKLNEKFGGLKNLERLPDAIFVCDMVKDSLAVVEARRKKIKIVAISDTNANPEMADYPIPANDDAITSVKYILEKVKEAFLMGKNQKNG